MLEPAQKRRLQRIQLLKNLLSKYNGGVNFEEFKSILMINYGFTEQKTLEYLKIIVESGFAEIDGEMIKSVKEAEK